VSGHFGYWFAGTKFGKIAIFRDFWGKVPFGTNFSGIFSGTGWFFHLPYSVEQVLQKFPRGPATLKTFPLRKLEKAGTQLFLGGFICQNLIRAS
jgi:hypothetical protein